MSGSRPVFVHAWRKSFNSSSVAPRATVRLMRSICSALNGARATSVVIMTFVLPTLLACLAEETPEDACPFRIPGQRILDRVTPVAVTKVPAPLVLQRPASDVSHVIGPVLSRAAVGAVDPDPDPAAAGLAADLDAVAH